MMNKDDGTFMKFLKNTKAMLLLFNLCPPSSGVRSFIVME